MLTYRRRGSGEEKNGFYSEAKLRDGYEASLHPQKNMEAFCGETKPRSDFEASPHP
jgi:hypothetical protein